MTVTDQNRHLYTVKMTTKYLTPFLGAFICFYNGTRTFLTSSPDRLRVSIDAKTVENPCYANYPFYNIDLT